MLCLDMRGHELTCLMVGVFVDVFVDAFGCRMEFDWMVVGYVGSTGS
jgi:hypothetical protein